jgi:hypothetical protein
MSLTPPYTICNAPLASIARETKLISNFEKGYDPLTEVKSDAAERWVAAVNADGTYGKWMYAIARKPEEVNGIIASAVAKAGT